jgi:hypothetical protein
LAGGRGLNLERSEAASTALLDDLRSDKGMEWTPSSMWLTYLRVQAEARDLVYDLAVSTSPTVSPSITDVGIDVPEARAVTAGSAGTPVWPIAAGVSAAIAAFVVLRSLRPRSSRADAS